MATRIRSRRQAEARSRGTWYWRNTYAGDTASVVESRGNIVAGSDLLSTVAIPGPVRKFPLVTLNGSIVYGQSNGAGQSQPALTTTAPYATNLTFSGGPRQRGTSSAVAIENDLDDVGYGDLGESICTGAMAETTRRGVAENGLAAADIPQFSSNASKPGVEIAALIENTTQWAILKDHLVKAMGIATAASKVYELTDLMWVHGESDTLIGTSRASYLSQFAGGIVEAVDRYARALTGQRRPVFTLVSQNPWRALDNDGPSRALYDASVSHPLVRYVMNCQCVPVAGDNLHFTNAGQVLMAYYFGRARKQLWLDGVRPGYLKPLAAIYDGTYITIPFSVPVAPLVIDTGTIAAATQNGVKVVDASGDVPLSNFQVVNGTGLRCTPDRSLNGAWTSRIGLDYASTGVTLRSSAATNLRDSTNEPITISGTPHQTWHWAPQCQIAGVNP